MVDDLRDTRRTEVAMTGLGERQILESWLGFHRATLLLKADGAGDEGRTRGGTPVSLRRIDVHMVEEHARHNGHADLIREMVDGAVGW